MPKVTVRNISPGFRGLNAETGYLEFNPGETREGVEITDAELKSARSTGYFEFGKDAAKADPGAPVADEFDGMDDKTLRDSVKVLTGKDAPTKADRAELLRLARGK